MHILNIQSAAPYRITATFDVAPDLTPGDYVLKRLDGASLASAVTYVFLNPPGSNTAEIAVGGEGMLDGVVYVLSLPGQPASPSAQIAYRQPMYQSQVPQYPAEDPEAEAFGVDIDWFADGLTGAGDTPTIRGRQCLTNDLAIIAMISKGEIFHRPDAGAGLKLDVNGPMTDFQVKAVVGALTKEWYRDARIAQNSVSVTASVNASTGQLTVAGSVTPLAIDDPTIVRLPGGGT